MRMFKGMFMTCGACTPSIQLHAGWGAVRHRGAGHESRINPNNLRQFVAAFCSFSLCFSCGLLVTWSLSALPRTKNNTVAAQSGKGNCFAVTRRCFSTPSWKSSFLRVLLSCGRRLALLHQEDSRVGRARIMKILAFAEWALLSLTGLARYWMPNRKKWWVVWHAFVPCVRGQAKDCMCACVRTFITSWEVLRSVDETPAVALHLFNCFGRCL